MIPTEGAGPPAPGSCSPECSHHFVSYCLPPAIKPNVHIISSLPAFLFLPSGLMFTSLRIFRTSLCHQAECLHYFAYSCLPPAIKPNVHIISSLPAFLFLPPGLMFTSLRIFLISPCHQAECLHHFTYSCLPLPLGCMFTPLRILFLPSPAIKPHVHTTSPIPAFPCHQAACLHHFTYSCLPPAISRMFTLLRSFLPSSFLQAECSHHFHLLLPSSCHQAGVNY
ncbi:hypothetical protein J6590_027165 [Homalodisca vitripennis]|nr:hypothetical protein J6590_027165 [Homalodisca vitripennis]